MKKIHVIAKLKDGIRREGLKETSEPGVWISGCWAQLGPDIETIVGGSIFLHEDSNSLSAIGGTIIEILPCERTDQKIEQGIAFKFRQRTPDGGRGEKWCGRRLEPIVE